MKSLKITVAGIAAFLFFSPAKPFAQNAEVSLAVSHQPTIKSTGTPIYNPEETTLKQCKELFPGIAKALLQNYSEIQDFTLSNQPPLVHTFFSELGNGMHVVFGKNNKKLLEVTTYSQGNYPATLLRHIQANFPQASIVVVKKIASKVDAWYEVLLKENDTLQKVDIPTNGAHTFHQ